jgi:hypothetical protein
MDLNQQIENLRRILHEIKRREFSMSQVNAQPERLLFQATVVEYSYLQFRRILEALAFSVVIANQRAAKQVGASMSKDYHAEKLMRWIEARFGSGYPTPVVQQMDPKPGIRSNLADFQGAYLTRTDFATLYARSGDVLHGKNPLRKPFDYDPFANAIPEWRMKLRNLLHNHTLRTVDDTHMFLIQMNTDDVDKSPSVDLFERLVE